MTAVQPRLIVFGREPRPGKVKTRLIPELGAEGAAGLYERLLAHTLAAGSRLDGVDKELWYDVENGEPDICRNLATRYGFRLHRQPEGNLGARMYHASVTPVQASERPLVLIGSDCPGYSADYLAQGISALAHQDAVIGPALDGGYLLIGLNRVVPLLFEDIAWGTETVMETTRARLRQLGWRWTELEPLRDLDRPSDLGYVPDWLLGPKR